MNIKNIIAAAALTAASCSAVAQSAIDAEGRAFIDQLMGRMTLHEKLGQLNLQVAGDITTGSAQDSNVGAAIARGDIGGVFNIKGVDKIRALQEIAVKQSRLGIPLIVGMDVIHGYETIFPIPLALSCTWDEASVEEAARISAAEASADGISWAYSPMVDIALDARWGRVSEGFGEDPHLTSLLGAAMVRGYQGTDLADEHSVMSCVKHFALYGAVESGRDYNTVDMSHLRMYNQYLPTYHAAVAAGAASVMTSFNLVDGVPATASEWLVGDVLRRQWCYDGLVVTDYGSINEILSHGTAATRGEASLQALAATTDMDMCSMGYLNLDTECDALSESQLKMVDEACRRVLEAKWRLGLFHDPYARCDPARAQSEVFTAASREAARRIAAETFVLLKNGAAAGSADGKPLLPLPKSCNIALIGPLGNNRPNMDGTWVVAAVPEHNATLYEAMQQAVAGRGQVTFAQGCNLTADAALQQAAEAGKTIERGDHEAMRQEAMRVAAEADVIVLAMGECADMSGECASRTDLTMPDVQRELMEQLLTLGKPTVLLNFAGRPTVLTREAQTVDAILNVWFGGTEMAAALCDVLFGDKAPCGRLTMSMPQTTGQEPLYYNHLNTGRPVPEGTTTFRKYQSNYLDVRNDPLYPFGYGLTYTSFDYGDMALSGTEMDAQGSVKATIALTNTGLRAGTEVVQLYIRDRVSRYARPVKELKDFARISLDAGTSCTVTFTITPDMLQYYDAEGHTLLEPGEFEIMIGPNSRDLHRATLTLKP
mgnify:CR=1 FL=1